MLALKCAGVALLTNFDFDFSLYSLDSPLLYDYIGDFTANLLQIEFQKFAFL